MSIDARQHSSRKAPLQVHGGTLAFRSKRVADDDEGAYQVDLIVTLFAVLMLLLTISSLNMGSDAKLVGYTRYSPTDELRRAFQLQMFSAVYPYRTFWVAKDGEFVEINLEAVARRYAAASELEWNATIDGADVSITSERGEPDGFRLQLVLFSRGVPAWLGDRRFELADADAIGAALLASPASSHVVVWPGQLKPLVPALAKVREVGKPLSLELREPNDNRVRIQRAAVDFQLNRILRGQ